MHCKYCGFSNSEDDHRCLRCGRRIGVAIAAPQTYAGANALALAPAVAAIAEPQSAPATIAPSVPSQPVLFVAPTSKIIPFDTIQRQAGSKPSLQLVRETEPARKSSPKKPAGASAEQGTLDFVLAAAPKPRTLKTEVEAVIFCDQVVATPMHRFVAASIDAAMILLGFGLFVSLSLGFGGSFGEGETFWIAMAAGFAVISLFYGSIWTLLGTESLGMRCTELELITFDGFPVEGSGRLLRFGATWLSFCSAGLGVLWSLVDEENLTWHDHISKTFPTIREVPRNFVRQRR